MILRLPRNYQRLEGVTPLAVAHAQYLAPFREVLAAGTLHAWAAAHPERREYRGRGPVYSAPLPLGGPRVVVRHAHRGGALAPVLGDLYLPPTPAPAELLIASLLARAGVPTPPVVGFATYRAAAGLLRRLDVMTLEIDGHDLVSALAASPTPEEHVEMVHAVARLLGALLNAGAWHQDLNARNILLTRNGVGELHAVALDVDRVRFVPAGDPHMASANLARLQRSMAKYAGRGEPALGDADFAEIERLVHLDEAERASARSAALEEHMPWQ